jgi:hypothetical protein
MTYKLNFWFDPDQTFTRGWAYRVPIIGDFSRNQSSQLCEFVPMSGRFALTARKKTDTDLDKRPILFGAMQPFGKTMLCYFKEGGNLTWQTEFHHRSDLGNHR